MSVPASGLPKSWPLSMLTKRQVEADPPSPGTANDCRGVTATGREGGSRAWRGRSRIPSISRPGSDWRSETSFASMTKPDRGSANSSRPAPIGTSPVTTAILASKSIPQAYRQGGSDRAGPKKTPVRNRPLIHQRIAPEAFRHRGAARAA